MLLLYFIDKDFVIVSLMFLLFPVLFIFARAVEEVCMVKEVDISKLTVGDWLYEDLFVNGKKIKKSWEGISEKELRLIRGKYNRKVAVKYGVPFTPSFFIGLVGILYLNRMGLF